LNNTAITQLEENTFYGITFEEIYIFSATKLKLIHTKAFNETISVTKYFRIDCTPENCLLSYKTPGINWPPNYDIFKALNSLINLEEIYLYNTNITEIPANAFQNLKNLKRINFDFSPIEKIENNAFYDLNELSLENTRIDWIPKNAFNLKENPKITLTLELGYNHLNGSSFEFGSMDNFKRRLVFHRPQLWSKEPVIYRSVRQTTNVVYGAIHIYIDSPDHKKFLKNWFDRPHLWSVETVQKKNMLFFA
jgi:Leucine-rich repeat (LRR) protein